MTVRREQETEAQQTERRFVLQRINAQVFCQTERVIQNRVVLSEPVRDRVADLPWHICFIEGAHVLESIQNAGHAEAIGYGLAMFHRLISTLPVDRLTDALEGFHITLVYLAQSERVRRNATAQGEGKTKQVRQGIH